jgi:hypothetical protein
MSEMDLYFSTSKTILYFEKVKEKLKLIFLKVSSYGQI